MLLLDLSNCGPSGLLRVVYFFKLIMDIVLIIIPIALIILLTIDFAKMMISNDDSSRSKTFKIAMKRILYAVLVFFVPTIVSIFNDILGDLGVDYSVCFNNINIDAINQLEAEEDAIDNAKQSAQIKLSQSEKEESANNDKISTSINSGEIYVASGSGCDGMVYYENGTFYKPSSSYSNGTAETKGSAAYGYNKYFYDMLSKMVNDASAAGYKITPSTSEYGAWRSFEIQQYYYGCYINQNCNNGNLAAFPGTSNHGWGIASDLDYGDEASIDWAHNNAGRYGLAFTVSSENWHIAPALSEIDDSVVTKCK